MTNKRGIPYPYYMYNDEKVVFFMDEDDAKKLNLDIIDTDEYCHAAVLYSESAQEWLNNDLLWWPQTTYSERDSDGIEIVIAEIHPEDACSDCPDAELFCSRKFAQRSQETL